MEKLKSLSTRARQRVATVFAVTALAAFMALPAFAEGSGVETVIEDGFSEMQGLITGTLAVALFVLVGIILAVTVGVKWLGRGAKNN